ncbi:sporulation protein YtfJ [Paenibacillus sp. Root52]|uniref:Sporulation protein YtfJ n=1 Tax=Paenibacillus amylolyticus TaxID=1451 RepID=A0AAP5H702_PAEAM|nr:MULTISPECIES: GerW family sporulation protein [Paenibacillus]KQY87716.1 sporulation protein YtfJ [Paenibacillus sp. Root52]MCG7375619.1 GerW family sporulation protein [Paenibacillus sp. ACRSA]MDR6725099.1 sporulation protein YtfJ [Paenibacillus amylolyticus]
MSDHPIQGLMETAMENIKAMVDVNTIVGDAVETPDGTVILPISKVGFGFAAGGSDFNVNVEKKESGSASTAEHAKSAKVASPFGGGSGGGVSIRPIAFLVVGKQGVHIVPLDNSTHLFEKLIDSTPYVMDRIQEMFRRNPSKDEPEIRTPDPSTYS